MEENQNSPSHSNEHLVRLTLRINPSLKIIFCGEDQVLITHGIKSQFKQIIRDEGRTGLLGRILRKIVALPQSLSDLIDEDCLKQNEIQDALNLVDALLIQGILTDINKMPIASYINSILGLPSSLSSASIGIVGSGQLGMQIAEEFAQINIGSMQVIDNRSTDTCPFELEHYNLGSKHTKNNLSYVEILKSRLQDIDYDRLEISKKSYTDGGVLEDFLARTNFAVVASEVFDSHLFHTVDMAALSVSTPWISVFLDGSEGCIGPIYVPGETCCYNEFEIQIESSLATSSGEYYTYKEAMSKANVAAPQFVFPPYLSIVSGFVANVVSSFLLSGKSYLVGRCLRINFEKPYVDYEEILKLPRSPTSVALRNGYRNTYL